MPVLKCYQPISLLQQLSQFWYSQETALRLAQEAIAAVGEGGR